MNKRNVYHSLLEIFSETTFIVFLLILKSCIVLYRIKTPKMSLYILYKLQEQPGTILLRDLLRDYLTLQIFQEKRTLEILKLII